jgi:hypothetical protein
MPFSPHTPGPWVTMREDSGVYFVQAKQGPVRVCVAHAFGAADAQLIAAAPALVEALERLLDEWKERLAKFDRSQDFDIPTRILEARAALRLARGE